MSAKIYRVENIITHEIYIGLTKKTLMERKRDHVYEAFKRNRKDLFHAALREFGMKNFTWSVVAEYYNYKKAAEEEMKLIEYYNGIEFGYNTCLRNDKNSNKKKSDKNNFVQMTSKNKIK